MNLSQLRFANALARSGSFTAAAAECFVTQPTLSNGIAQLESELGERLFLRTTRKVTLTPFGTHLMPSIAEVLRAQAGLSQVDLAQALGLRYYTFVSQVENGFGRVPTESLEAWARALGVEPSAFARELLSHYEPELHRLLFKESKARK